LLKNARWMPVRADQIFEKIHLTAHGCKFLVFRGFFKDLLSVRDVFQNVAWHLLLFGNEL
jgi:hypothetical protein